MVGRGSGRLPGASAWAYLKLYCGADRAAELLTTRLPGLLSQGETDAPLWWFTRYHDPDHHLRLRMRLPHPGFFGDAARRVAAWAAELRQEGLVQRLQWDTDEPETGRYGTGTALEAAEGVFAADSAAALAQLALPIPDRLRTAVTAAGFVDLASGLLGSPAAARRWLVSNLSQTEGDAVPRDVLRVAVRLAEPDPARRALHDLPGGDRVAAAWSLRRDALAAYRNALEGHGLDEAAVLPSLLHMHHNRTSGIAPEAEATCRRLARAAALSWATRTEGASR